jgi:excisionase family DNA binding protein
MASKDKKRPGNQPAERLTVPEMAAALAVDLSTAHRLIAEGVLRAVKLGRRLVRVPRADIDLIVAGGVE